MAEFRFLRRFRYAAIATDGGEVRDYIHARDLESAEADLREKGLAVYRLTQITRPEHLERHCAECQHVNNWGAGVCENCGAADRAPRVGPGERVELAELPDDLVVRENSDGSVTLMKTGWKRLAPAIVLLGALTMPIVLVTVRPEMTPNDPAAQYAVRLANITFGLLGAAVLVACTLWILFDREEWRVGKGYVEHRRSLFGMDRGHVFRPGVIRLVHSNHHGLHNLRVSVLDRKTSRTLYEDQQAASDTALTTLAALLAQRTGWVLDKRIFV